MKYKTKIRIITFILCMAMLGDASLSAFAEPSDAEEEAEQESLFILKDVEKAQKSLKELVVEREIPALIYLKDIYTIKTAPDSSSNDVVSIAAGQQVLITGVAEDSAENIWYQVTYRYDEGEFSGYVQREYLAFSDERLLEWEENNIRAARNAAVAYSAADYADVEQFPESYQNALYQLKRQHPNWKFVKMETGLDFNNVVALQREGSRSLINNSTALDSWKDGYYSKSWSIASEGILKYYLDPRNSFTETLIFQFEQLTYNPSLHSVSSTQQVLEGTFMDSIVPGTDMYYAAAFMSIAAEKNISPTLMASRVRQEQGAKGSLMISGTYPGFEGLYNYYNIGASGNTQEQELVSGLTKAREMGWTTHMLSLSGGSSVLSNSYIRHGQDTLYLQKFDVDSSYDGVCWHQYMQNIEAPTSEASSTYKAYKKVGILNSSFVFRIPVYKNMPSYACTKPGSTEKITLNVTSVENLPVGETAVLLSYINGSQNTTVAMEYTSSDTSVATVDANGVVTAVKPGTVTITCKRKENPSSATTASCTVTIVKADISLSNVSIPQMSVTYSPTQKLSSIQLPEGFQWVDGEVVPTVENNGYMAFYNPNNSIYNTLTLRIPCTVNKAAVDMQSLTLPKNLTAVAGTELRSVALPSGYYWKDAAQTLPKKVGTYNYTALYCVDSANYEVLDNITLAITVTCKTHEFGDWSGTHADCTTEGVLTRSCSICGEKETMTETAKGHSYTSEITKEPTPIQPGVRTYTCAECQDSYDVEIPATVVPHTHQYTDEVTVEPGCETTGIRTYTCSCKDVYTEVIAVLGHDMEDGECQRCGHKTEPLPSHSHSYTLAENTATCTSAGIATYACSCGESYTENCSPLGHSMSGNKCERCDYQVGSENVGSGNTGNSNGAGSGSGTTGGNAGSGSGTTGGSAGSGNAGNGSGTTGGSAGSGSTGNGNGAESGSGTTGGSAGSGSTGNGNGAESGSGTTGGSTGSGNTGNGNGAESGSGTIGGSAGSGSGTTGGNAGNGNGAESGSGTTGGSTGSGNTGNGNGAAGGNAGSENAGNNNGATGGSVGSGNTGNGNGAAGGNAGSENAGNSTGTAGSNAGNNNSTTSGGTGNSSSTPAGNTGSSTTGGTENTAEANKNSTSVLGAIQNMLSSVVSNKNQQQLASAPISEVTTSGVQSAEEEKPAEAADTQEEIEETQDAVKITMKHSTILNKDKLAIAADTKSRLELVMADDIVWKLDLSSVSDIQNMNVDMAVTLHQADIPEKVLAALPQNLPIITLSLAHDGPFEFGAVLKVPLNQLNAGKYANLFYYNPDTEAMEFIADAIISENGDAEFTMEHASDYAIVIADASMNPHAAEEEISQDTDGTDQKESKVFTVCLVVIGCVVVVAAAAALIVFGVRFLKKKSEDKYYFDEEDESLEDTIK